MANEHIKDVLRRLPYGLYSITSRKDDEINAMVLNWFSQVSFDPQLVAIAVQKTSYSYKLISQGKVFIVNVFNKEDVGAIKPFIKGHSKSPDKMKDAMFTEGSVTACPILVGAAAYLECKVTVIHDVGGDHNIIVGEVVGAGSIKPGDVKDALTLPYLGWSYAG
jgi:flavin reductase (DIM6/NTAB) family NADH-FMN oxidoreductase RutF